MNPLANLDEATQKRLFEHMAGFFLSQPATSAPPPNPPPAPAPPPSATIVSIPPPYIAPPAAVSSYSSQHASTSSSSQPYLQSPVQGPRDIRAMLDAQHGVPYGRESVPNHSGVGSIHHHAGGRIQVRGHPLQRQQKKPNKIGRPVSIVSTGKVAYIPCGSLIRNQLAITAPGKTRWAPLIEFLEIQGYMRTFQLEDNMSTQDIAAHIEKTFQRSPRLPIPFPAVWSWAKLSGSSHIFHPHYVWNPWQTNLSKLKTEFKGSNIAFVFPQTWPLEIHDNQHFRADLALAIHRDPLTWEHISDTSKKGKGKQRAASVVELEDVAEDVVQESDGMQECKHCNLVLPAERMVPHWNTCPGYRDEHMVEEEETQTADEADGEEEDRMDGIVNQLEDNFINWSGTEDEQVVTVPEIAGVVDPIMRSTLVNPPPSPVPHQVTLSKSSISSSADLKPIMPEDKFMALCQTQLEAWGASHFRRIIDDVFQTRRRLRRSSSMVGDTSNDTVGPHDSASQVTARSSPPRRNPDAIKIPHKNHRRLREGLYLLRLRRTTNLENLTSETHDL
ncbi:hypothetical protein HD553DRAFT_346621 [Filobasidium floriforme]|uniref:uncharacterized protein n=1 Tax=Filobasidium floriforme TaxID=5210 RepID=UPI001E8E191E|nr:uncharacterized protein HD553DRAFT_346621 [Filobasidium floriforme]KAH8077447.1 hypothetical protein HD553DRAFT_346621 [Filobasidium floriforme]